MESREWLYYIVDKYGRSIYRRNGLNDYSSVPKPLRYTPDGWQDINIGYERSIETWGNNRNYSLPNNFVLDGCEILAEIFHTKNIEEELYLLIQKLTLVISPTEYYFFHKYFYRGELDMSTGKDQLTKFTVNIMEGGLSKAYKAYQSAKYEVDPTDVYVKMDGIVFRGTKRFAVLEASYAHGFFTGGPEIQEQIPMIELNSEGNFFNWYFNPEVSSTTDPAKGFITVYNVADDPEDRANGEVTANTETSFHMYGTIQKDSFGGIFNGNFGYNVKVLTNTGRFFDLFPLSHLFTFDGQQWSFDLTSAVFQIDKSEKFYVYITPIPGTNNVWQFLDDVRFEYETRDIYKTTYVKAKRASSVYSDLVNKISSQTGLAQSSLLASKQNYVLTSGDTMRGIPNSKIKTSLDDLRKFCDVVENIGVGVIQGKLYLEKKEFFLQDNNVINLGKVKVNSVDKAKELMGSIVKIGYEHQNSDDVNGKYSFNNTSTYTLPIKRVSNTIEKTTNYITDPYVIELYRANTEGKNTTDDSKDSDIIALNIDYANPQTLAEDTDGLPAGTVYYNLKRVVYDVITGVIDSTKLYNIEDFTPRRCMEKYMSFFDSILTGFDGEFIEFQNTDENRELFTSIAGVSYDEDANIQIGNAVKLFKPTYFDITPETSAEIVEILETNPNRCFQFEHENGYTYRGFNMKIGIAANSLKEEAYKLLAVWNQDLTTLKNR